MGGQTRGARKVKEGQDRCGGMNRFELRIYYTRKYSIEVTGLSSEI